MEPCTRHSPISGATRQAYASFWPGIGPRQLSLAKRAIPDWLRPRLPPPPPGGGTWVRVCVSCNPRGSRSPTSWPPQSLVRFFTRLRALRVRRPGNSWGLRTEHQDRWRCLKSTFGPSHSSRGRGTCGAQFAICSRGLVEDALNQASAGSMEARQ